MLRLNLRKITALTAVLSLFATGRADASTCSGKNVFPDLKTAEPALYEAIRKEADATDNAKTLLWQIENNDAPGLAPSYLFGTVHSTDDRVHALSPKIKEAIQASRRVALEVDDMSTKRMAQAIQGSRKVILFPEGKKLDALLTPEEMTKVSTLLTRAGWPAAAVGTVRPWFALLIASRSECERSRLALGRVVLDTSIQKNAENRGLGAVGLETIESQFAAMAAIPEADQVALLKSQLAQLDKIEDNHETLIQLYLNRDLGAIWPLHVAMGRRSGVSDATFNNFAEQLLHTRNHNMRDRALLHLNKGGVFIAVGALHLPGKTGMVTLLREMGYKLTAVE